MRLLRNLLRGVGRHLTAGGVPRPLLRVPRLRLRRPVFLVGAPRSGTTFLGECTGTLPDISYFNEPTVTKYAAGCVYREAWPRWLMTRYYRLSYSGLLWASGAEGERLAEKTPRNCFLLPFLISAFPDARVVHLIRDGRDAALSWSRKPWLREDSLRRERREDGGYPYGPHPRFWVEPDRREEFFSTSDIHRCIWGWRRHVEAAREAARSSLPEEAYLEVRYERLVKAPLDVGGRIAAHLGARPAVPFREKLKAARPDSVGRWRAELAPGELEDVRREAGGLLADLGYGG